MKGIRVDPAERTVRVEGGCVWGDVDHATHRLRAGDAQRLHLHTGVGGLTLGGGIGYLSRTYGLTIDNLLGVDMVLADGSFVTASAEGASRSVLGGARRRRQLRRRDLVPVPAASDQHGLWRPDVLAAGAGGRGDATSGATSSWTRPRTSTAGSAFVTVPPAPPFPEQFHLQKMCAIVWCYTGPLEQAEERFAPIRAFSAAGDRLRRADPLAGAAEPVRRALSRRACSGTGRPTSSTSLSDQAIELHVKYGAQLPTMHSTMHLYPINGAAHRRRQERHRVQLPRRQLRRGDRRGRSRPGQQRAHDRSGPGTTGWRCIPTRPAAPTST